MRGADTGDMNRNRSAFTARGVTAGGVAPTRVGQAARESNVWGMLPMLILRGFIGSGTSRARSIDRMPLATPAPRTRMKSARLKRRSKLPPVMPRCRNSPAGASAF
jgi:hypothetical protein